MVQGILYLRFCEVYRLFTGEPGEVQGYGDSYTYSCSYTEAHSGAFGDTKAYTKADGSTYIEADNSTYNQANGGSYTEADGSTYSQANSASDS